MRLVSFAYAGQDGCGFVEGTSVVPLLDVDGSPYRSLDALLQAGDLPGAVRNAGRGQPVATHEVTLLPPVRRPTKIVCAGVNYHAHLQETGRDRAEYPTLFTRFADTQVGHLAPLIIPAVSDRLDYEGELAVVIGRRATQVAVADAWGVIAGYSCYNDGSARDWQRHTSQWIPGKNFPNTGAFGPALVTADEIDDVTQLQLTTMVNGDLRQQASLSSLIFSIPELIHYVTSFTTLYPGDVIVTGTPGGVGLFRDPPEFLQDGDVVEVTVSGVGTLRNPVANEQHAGRPAAVTTEAR